jgi:hypothetical protein
MKALVEIAVALVASLGMFGVCVAVATAVLTEQPASQSGIAQSVAGLWTDQPRKVNPAQQNFERLPAREVAVSTIRVAASSAADAANAAVDATVTASVRSLPNLSAAAHHRWCVERYRSYREENDSYISYSGRRRRCVSPYSNNLRSGTAFASLSATAEVAAEPALQNMSHDGEGVGWSRHVRNCFSRYRSYRVEDNTYQPYDGGTRRQCR